MSAPSGLSKDFVIITNVQFVNALKKKYLISGAHSNSNPNHNHSVTKYLICKLLQTKKQPLLKTVLPRKVNGALMMLLMMLVMMSLFLSIYSKIESHILLSKVKLSGVLSMTKTANPHNH